MWELKPDVPLTETLHDPLVGLVGPASHLLLSPLQSDASKLGPAALFYGVRNDKEAVYGEYLKKVCFLRPSGG